MRRLTKEIRCVGLIANTEKPSCGRLLRRAAGLIRAAGRGVIAEAATAEVADLRVRTCLDAAGLTRHADLVMVFGGDGTMLRVARDLAGSRTPILGINIGGLGFLTDVQAHQLPLALKQIWAGETLLGSRALMEVSGRAQGRPFTQRALNDFVITRVAAPHLIDLEVTVDGEILTRYRCDGLIVCTPTGSTAYSLSAGGAIVSPSAQVFALTPICPHTLSNRSVIIGLSSTVQVRVLSEEVENVLSADGQSAVPLKPGDVVTIRRSRHSVRLLHLAGSSFFGTLRRKLNWSGTIV